MTTATFQLERISFNFSGTTRREKFEGRDYIVAPMTLIVPGVLNGSRGPMLYPLEEIQKNPSAWNGMPIVLDHPTHNGTPVSARTKDVLEKSRIGVILNTSAEDKLTAEGYFDIEKTRKVAPQILNQLESGQKIELSTGLGGDEDKQSGNFNSVSYNSIYRNYRPDHLAVFTDKIGSCSIDSGCGVNNEDKKSLWKKLGEILGVTNNETKTQTEENKMKDQLVTDLIANCDCWTEDDKKTLNDLSEEKLKSLNEDVKNSKKRDEQLKQQEVVINKVKEGYTVGEVKVTLNEKGELESNPVKPKKEEKSTDNEKKTEMKFEDLPEDVRNKLGYLEKLENEKKEFLINQLIVNVKDEDKAQTVENLMKNSIEEIEERLRYLPEPEEQDVPAYNYSGMAPAPKVTNENLQPVGGKLEVVNWDFNEKDDNK